MKEPKITTHIVPAAPGYRAFKEDVDDAGKVHTDLAPVIAWKITTDDVTDFVAVEPVADDHWGSLTGKVRPDGTVYHNSLGDYADIDAFKAEVLSRLAAPRPENPSEI